MRELMTERQEQLIALHEEEKRRRALSPRLSDAGSPTMTSGQVRGSRDALSPPSTSPVLAKQRPGKGRDSRPISWPPLVVGEDEDAQKDSKGLRTSSGSYGRNEGARGGSSGKGRQDYRSNELAVESSAFPSVPRTILEEDEDDDDEDSSDLDFY